MRHAGCDLRQRRTAPPKRKFAARRVDLIALQTVAEEQSFTRAAAKLGTAQSAISYTTPDTQP
jgi:hypothetical protein